MTTPLSPSLALPRPSRPLLFPPPPLPTTSTPQPRCGAATSERGVLSSGGDDAVAFSIFLFLFLFFLLQVSCRNSVPGAADRHRGQGGQPCSGGGGEGGRGGGDHGGGGGGAGGMQAGPQGGPLTQLNLAASVNNIRSVYPLSEPDATVVVLPLFHVHGLVVALLSSLAAGAPRRSQLRGASRRRHSGARCTRGCHVPEPEGAYLELRFVRSCSASLAQAVLARLEAALDAPVLEAYAMTEAAHLMTSNPLPEDDVR
uniref:AMP-dependent synthetase/ligase domain-containing protein n=1 Tax=Ananas comosus var. bracteatus TaxID=296719 RepID=A0A6V7QJU9_ANACO|nr:unnamed protein product [Ananas comosus var. bracteatus]